MLELFRIFDCAFSDPAKFIVIAAMAVCVIVGVRWGIALEKAKAQDPGNLTVIHFCILIYFAALIGGIIWYVGN